MEVRADNLRFVVDEAGRNAYFNLPGKSDGTAKETDFWRLILDDGLPLEIPVVSHKQTGIVRRTEAGLLCEYHELISEYGDV